MSSRRRALALGLFASALVAARFLSYPAPHVDGDLPKASQMQKALQIPQKAESGNRIARPPFSGAKSETESTGRPSRTPSSRSLEDLLKTLDPQGEWKIRRTGEGRVASFSGGLLPGHADSAESNLGLARELALQLRIEPESLTVDESFVEPNPNPLSRTFNFRQTVDGYEVYGGYLRLFARAEDGSIYFVNSRLRQVRERQFDINVSSEMAQAIALTHYPQALPESLEVGMRPLIYADGPPQGELAWRIVFRTRQPRADRREILVSAESGAIIHDVSMMVY